MALPGEHLSKQDTGVAVLFPPFQVLIQAYRFMAAFGKKVATVAGDMVIDTQSGRVAIVIHKNLSKARLRRIINR